MRQTKSLFIALTLIASAGLASAIWIAGGQDDRTESTGAASIGGPFALKGVDGNPVRDADFRGRLMLVFFGYTNCPDICPATLQTIAQALDSIGEGADKIAALFITLDPERDTALILQAYTASISPRIIPLTGNLEEIAKAAKAYRVYFRKANTEPADTAYTLDHSTFGYLMDENGRYLTHFTFETPAAAIADALKKQLKKEKTR